MKVLIVGINGWYIYHFWKPLLMKLKSESYKITIIVENDQYAIKLVNLGFKVKFIEFNNQSINPFKNILSILNLMRLYKSSSPDLVHHFNPKPVIFGTFAAKLLGIKIVINNYPGLGNLFRKDKLKFRFISPIVKIMYKLINSSSNIHSVFQVKEDIDTFVRKKLIRKSKSHLIQSSGVDLNYFKIRNTFNINNKLRIGMISRLNSDKGLDLYFDLAKRLKNNKFTFILAGQLDKETDINNFNKLCKINNITYIGFVENIKELLLNLDIVILPTRRFEGIPKIMIEAAATGATLISSNLGGCKEIVLNEKNGYIFSLKNIIEDAYKNIILIEKNRNLIEKFGYNSRKLVENNFDINLVINQYAKIYKDITKIN